MVRGVSGKPRGSIIATGIGMNGGQRSIIWISMDRQFLEGKKCTSMRLSLLYETMQNETNVGVLLKKKRVANKIGCVWLSDID